MNKDKNSILSTNKKYNVLSLCDGMSCGHIALDKVGIEVGQYFAAEIKDIGIKITMENYPGTIQIGDVNKVSYSNGVLHTEKGDFKVDFDLVIFGSPCQSVSRAMKKDKRIGLNDSIRSGLFYECNRILKEVNPKYFLMENVVMDKKFEQIISDMMGVNPIRINSKLLTAQMRDRLYWTNIPNVTVPDDKEITLNDVLIDGYYPYDKARCLMCNDSHGYYNGCNWTPSKRFYRWYYKAFSTMIFPSKEDFDLCVKEFEKVTNGNKPSASQFDDYIGNVFDNARYLWKEERARLQGVPVDYIKTLTEKEAADLLGDGWTVDVISHIFNGLKII